MHNSKREWVSRFVLEKFVVQNAVKITFRGLNERSSGVEAPYKTAFAGNIWKARKIAARPKHWSPNCFHFRVSYLSKLVLAWLQAWLDTWSQFGGDSDGEKKIAKHFMSYQINLYKSLMTLDF